MGKWLAGLTGLAVCASVHADSWAPPSRETYTSADGTARVVVTPRGIDGQLEYFSDKVDGKEPAGQAAGAQSRPVAELYLQQNGRWTFARKFDLVNDVAPVKALVAPGGKYLVTFDNWHSAGFGPDVVVIYDGNGRTMRSLALKDLLPPAYIAHLPRSVSSLWWRQDERILSDGETLEIHVIAPARHSSSKNKDFVPRRIRLADGVVLPGGAEWDKALSKVKALEVERQSRWDALRVERAKPLLPPQGTTSNDAWRAYMVELRDRLDDATGKVYSGAVYQPGAFLGDADSVLSDLLEYEDGESLFGDRFLIVAPDTHALAVLLADHLSKRPRNAMRGARIAFAGTQADRDVVNAVGHAGAEIEWIDTETPYPGQTLPPEIPEWFD